MPAEAYTPIFELTRGDMAPRRAPTLRSGQAARRGAVESIHFGAIAIMDVDGRLIAQHGDPNVVTFLRSSAKPFQALPFIQAGGAAAFELSAAEIALICASHSGTDEHVATVRSIQAKSGVAEADLLCGVHPPLDEATAEALRQRGEEPTPNRHNCSGKHTGMLAYARMEGWPRGSASLIRERVTSRSREGLSPTADYIDPDHPVQESILQTFAEMCDLSPEQVALGVDGCSAPNFAVPLRNTALAYARLCDPRGLSPARAAACRTITNAMTSHPEMVAGRGRFDTRLMEVGAGRIVAKGGAEGYQALGLLPGALGPGSPGVGIAMKISDGDLKGRVRPGVSLEVLRQLGALSPAQVQALADFGPVSPVRNWRGLVVGQARPRLDLRSDGVA